MKFPVFEFIDPGVKRKEKKRDTSRRLKDGFV